ncbi:NADH:ubiquinone reductase (Na(+)-transporting) subunit D [Pseudoprevotella muciniphila]|uniref:Na(+)-translocating NADH-quinone reductase subunit D n=1 Tax=Pseudoprevotella muciniphila TaxID=2133944 RepID=A0A5P8E4B9_9BACT|nr:NADH:ubiquinone reductase (Na(+)-transporting) subunit D [Pseudoprevotella muciniphila]QFQ11802.1 NADH:ubiquinone reductase (Na(+)-transporting) subunit D [Pseudoprevotella muciniphila]
MALFSAENKRAFMEPLNLNNPVLIQVLGICSALAVTSKLEPSIVMGLSVTVITAFSNIIISLLRKTIPNRIRIIIQLVVVAALVTIVSMVLKAFAYDVSVQLSVYVGLIITNCILMGRLEAFAMTNAPWPSLLDGIGSGLGYAWILVAVGAIRELFGNGTLLDIRIFPEGYPNNGMMTMPAMAMIILGCIIWAHRSVVKIED